MKANFRLTTNGSKTVIEMDGKTIGPGVMEVEFKHIGGESPSLRLDVALERFEFLPDGSYDREAKMIMEMNNEVRSEEG